MAARRANRPEIRVPDFQLEVREFFKEFRRNFKNLHTSFNTYNNLVVGILAIGFVVLLFTLATIIMQAWQTASTFSSDINQLNIQSEIIKNNVEQQETTNQKLNKIEEMLKSSQPASTK